MKAVASRSASSREGDRRKAAWPSVAILTIAALLLSARPTAAQRFDGYASASPASRADTEGMSTAHLLARARQALSKKQWVAAEESLNAAVREAPSRSEVHVLLGQLEIKRGRPEAAASHLRRAVNLKPDDAEAHFYLGVALQLRKDWARASQAYERAVSINPRAEPAWLNLSTALRNQGDFPRALRALSKAQALNPRNPATRANLHLLSRLPVANKQRIEPEGIRKLALIAAGHQKAGRYDDAIATYKKLLKIDPTNSSVLLDLGVVYCRQQKWNEARPVLQEARRLSPQRPEPHLNHAMTFLAEKRWAQAESGLREMLARFPKHSLARQAFAYSLLGQNKRDQAVAVYQRAIALFPKELPSYHSLAAIYQQENRLDAATELVRSARKVAPKDPAIRDKLSELLQRQGKWAEVETLYREGIQQEPRNATLRIQFARVLEREKRDESIAQYREAARLAPKEIAPRLSVCRLLNQKGDASAAVTAYEELIRTFPGADAAYTELGTLYERAKKWSAAASLYRRWLARGMLPTNATSKSSPGFEPSSPQPQALAFLVRALELDAKEPEAVKTLVSALQREPRWVEARSRLIGLYEKSKDFAAARRCGEEGLQASPREQRLYDAVWRSTDSGKLESPLRFFRRLMRKYPMEPAVYYAVSTTCEREKVPARAIDELKPLADKDPRNLILWRALAQVYHQNGRSREVIECLRHLTKMELRNPAHSQLLAKQLEIYGDFPASLTEYDRWLAFEPGSLPILHAKATLLEKFGRRLDSAAVYRSILKASPKDQTSFLALGRILEAESSHGDAFKLYQQMVATLPERPEGYAGVLRVAKKSGRIPEAERFWQKLVSGGKLVTADTAGRAILELYLQQEGIDPARRLADSWAALNPALRVRSLETLVGYYQRYDRRADLIQGLNELIRLKPGNLELHMTLAGVYDRDGQPDKALDTYRRVISTDPKQTGARYAVGRLLEQQGKRVEALTEFRELLRLQPDNASAKEAVNRLSAANSTPSAVGSENAVATLK